MATEIVIGVFLLLGGILLEIGKDTNMFNWIKTHYRFVCGVYLVISISFIFAEPHIRGVITEISIKSGFGIYVYVSYFGLWCLSMCGCCKLAGKIAKSNKQINIKTEEDYRSKLQEIAEEFAELFNKSWNRIRPLLIDRAARFFIRENIIKSGRNPYRCFPNEETCNRFHNELWEPTAPSSAISNLDICKYCAVLFLVLDECTKQSIYTDIKAQAQFVTDGHLSLDETPPLFEEYLAVQNNPIQNTKTAYIFLLINCLDCVKKYLKIKKLI